MKTMGETIYRAENLPVLQNRLYSSREAAMECPVGDLTIARNRDTGIVTNSAFRPEFVIYDENYNNEQGNSKAFQTHLDDVSNLIRTNFLGSEILEIGCGKGRFLSILRARGFTVKGIDPTYEGDDPLVEKRFFDAECGLRSDAIVLRHVLEHIVDPVDFLRGIKYANGGGGMIYIEVPCFDWICENRAWYDLFYEHVNYFTSSDFDRIFAVPPVISKTFSGQYLSVFADLASLRDRESLKEHQARATAIPSFSSEAENSVAELKKQSETGNKRIIVWGAASKGVIYALHMVRAGIEIDFVVDIDSAKQNKFLPATGLRVESPDMLIDGETTPSLIVVVNRNYLGEIRKMVPDLHEFYTI